MPSETKEADLALERLRERWNDDPNMDFRLTNIGGDWRVILSRQEVFHGDTPDEAVERALNANN